MSIAIVTDSTCDIPYDLANKFNIYIVPNILIINGESVEDDKDFSRQEFYERLPEMDPLPTTATESSGTYEALYSQLLQGSFTRVLSIHTSSLLSGIFNAARLAAQNFEDKVQVIDSRQVSLGLGFQVLEAAQGAIEGLSLETILAQVEQVRARTQFIAMLDTLEYIRRSGRVSWARARLGSLLRIKPFLEVVDGGVRSLGEVRTRGKGFERLLNILQDLRPFERLAILHTNAEEDARKLLQALNPDLPTRPMIVNVTTVIGTHVGPKCLGFVAVTK